MNQIEFAVMISEEREFIKREMKAQGLSPSQLASLSHLQPLTAINFLDGVTFSPHHRTVVGLFYGLGFELALPTGKKIVRFKHKAKKPRKKMGS